MGLRSKKFVGFSSKLAVTVGMTGKSSWHGTWWNPIVYQSVISLFSISRFLYQAKPSHHVTKPLVRRNTSHLSFKVRGLQLWTLPAPHTLLVVKWTCKASHPVSKDCVSCRLAFQVSLSELKCKSYKKSNVQIFCFLLKWSHRPVPFVLTTKLEMVSLFATLFSPLSSYKLTSFWWPFLSISLVIMFHST